MFELPWAKTVTPGFHNHVNKKDNLWDGGSEDLHGHSYGVTDNSVKNKIDEITTNRTE